MPCTTGTYLGSTQNFSQGLLSTGTCDAPSEVLRQVQVKDNPRNYQSSIYVRRSNIKNHKLRVTATANPELTNACGQSRKHAPNETEDTRNADLISKKTELVKGQSLKRKVAAEILKRHTLLLTKTSTRKERICYSHARSCKHRLKRTKPSS